MATIIQHSAFAGNKGMGVREEAIAESSFIQKVKYDASQMALTVTMKSGAEYVHYQVFPQTFEQMMQSPSKGAFYAREIKGKTTGANVVDKKTGPRLHQPWKGPALQSNQRGNHV